MLSTNKPSFSPRNSRPFFHKMLYYASIKRSGQQLRLGDDSSIGIVTFSSSVSDSAVSTISPAQPRTSQPVINMNGRKWRQQERRESSHGTRVVFAERERVV